MAALTNKLRIGTWNIHEAVPADQDHRDAHRARGEIAEILMRYKLDIVGLQEVDFDASSRSLTLEAISKNTPLKHGAHNILSESSFDPGDQAGVAVMSRYPMKNVRRERFRNPDLNGDLNGTPIRMFDKGYVSATISTDYLTLSTVSLHLFPFHLFGRDADEPAFAGIWSDLSNDLAHLAPALNPLLVCGDFNTSKRAFISTANLPLSNAVVRQSTYLNDSIDDILFTPHFQLESVEIIRNFSDHSFCVAELVSIPARVSV